MPLEVVDADERQAKSCSYGLALGDPDEKRPHEPGPHSRCDCIEIPERHVGEQQGFGDGGGERLDVGARGDLGNDPSVLSVELSLGCNDVGKDLAAPFDHCRGGLVARSFDAQDQDTVVPLLERTRDGGHGWGGPYRVGHPGAFATALVVAFKALARRRPHGTARARP